MPLSWDQAKDISGILGPGLSGFGAPNTTMNGSGTSENNQMQQGNTNNFNTSNLTTWLSNLFNSLNELQGQSTTSFNLDPATQALLSKLTESYSKLATPFDSAKYQAGQIRGINANADLQRQAVQNIMASRGVSGPAAATAEANVDKQRFANITSMESQLPFLANQWNTGNLGQAANFFSMIPKSQTTTNQQTQSTSSSQNTSGNQVSNQQGGSTYYNDGWSKTNQQQMNENKAKENPILKAAGLGASILPFLFSDETLKKDIEELPKEKVVEKFMKLRPVTWKWRKDDRTDVGVIAQDIQKVMPELVRKDPEGSGKLQVNYAGLISELVAGLQAVNKKVEALG